MKRTPSVKRRSQQAAREVVRRNVLDRDRGCRARGLIPGHVCASPDPQRPQLECHEVIPRSVWPDGWLVESNIVSLCQQAHDYVGDNPKHAHELGLHGFSWERPEATS